MSELGSSSSSEAGGLRVVFQYNGLLEAGPGGGYSRLVTWSPDKYKEQNDWRENQVAYLPQKPDISYEDVKLSVLRKARPTKPVARLVTWVPSITQSKETDSDYKHQQALLSNTISQDGLARKEVFFERENFIRPKNVFYEKYKQSKYNELVWTGHQFDPIPLSDVVPTSAHKLLTDNGADQPVTTTPTFHTVNRRLQVTTTATPSTTHPQEPLLITLLKGFVGSASQDISSVTSTTTASTTTTTTTTTSTTTTLTTTTTITTTTTTRVFTVSPSSHSEKKQQKTIKTPQSLRSQLVFQVFPATQNIVKTTEPPVPTTLPTTLMTSTSKDIISDNLVELQTEREKTKFLSWLNDDQDYLPPHQLVLQNKPLVKTFPQVAGLIPTTTVSPLNLLDWLASKSKLKGSERSSTTVSPPVRSVDGDVLQFWQSSKEDYQVQQDDMDTAESSVQVR